MTPVLVEAGPHTVRGPGRVRPDWVTAALESIDDPITLVDDVPVDTVDLWHDVLHAAADGSAELAVVVPTWWPRQRVEVIIAAAARVSPEYAVLTRPDGSVVTDRDGPQAVTLPETTGPADGSPVDALPPSRRPGRRAVAVMAGVAVTVTAAAGGWAAQTFSAVPRPQPATRTVVEGRVALQVPAGWTVERVTGDSGSARLRVAAPGGLPALHVTQSVGTTTVPLAEVGESLRAAVESETHGVFVDFDAAGTRAGRPAVTYVEQRTATSTRWAVIVDGALRIAIGCQHEPGRRDSIERVCTDAVGSAHAVS